MYAAHALNALDDDGADIALLYLAHPGSGVVEREEGDVVAVVDGRIDARIVGHLDGQRRAPVKGAGGGDDPRAAVVEGGELEGVLIGLRTRVDEEQGIVLISRGVAQTRCELDLQAVAHGVGIEAQARELTRDGFDVVGMAVTDAYHSVAAVEVEIFVVLSVPHLAAAAAHDLYIV